MIGRSRVPFPAEEAGEFSSLELTFCTDSYSVAVLIPVLLQQNITDPRHSAKSAGGRPQLNTRTFLKQRSQSRLTMQSMPSVGTYQGNELECNSSGNARLQSFQLAEPLWTDPDLNSGNYAPELVFT